ncbi:MAG: CYTH domain-containing protein [Minisyncoccia bacterium]
MLEIETKVLEIDVKVLKEKLKSLDAKEIQNTRLTVDWYSPPGVGKGKYPWYLRIRTDTDGKSEVTLKSLLKITGNTKQAEEINIDVSDAMLTEKLFEKIGLEHYAHQEKDRTSWLYKDWRFDLDKYPGMPAYLEIEGKSYNHVQEAIKLLGLTDRKSVGEGERNLIDKEYKLNWSDMRFK